jgi:pimeloyl-ACP methyl ester carboxylesterase
LGEESRDRFLSLDVGTRAAVLVEGGLPETDAAGVASAMDRRMFDHILPLYRSEAYLEDWAFDPAATYPAGLVLWGRDDDYQAAEFGRIAAAASGARFHELACGHWWQVERPDEVATLVSCRRQQR